MKRYHPYRHRRVKDDLSNRGWKRLISRCIKDVKHKAAMLSQAGPQSSQPATPSA